LLEVFLKYRNPVSIITKNNVMLRDMDIISELARTEPGACKRIYHYA
jgi:DNA repair photolyase